MAEIDWVHHDSVTYGNGFAVKSEVDFANGIGKIIAVRVKTNADRIRGMSDEELAEMLNKSIGYACDGNCHIEENKCVDCILAWLKKEADDEL